MQVDKETYLLLLLSDANLPTGSFVASTGLESTAAHVLFHVPATPPGSDTLAFLQNSVDTYPCSMLPFACDAHRITTAYASGEMTKLDEALQALSHLDALYNASTLNYVTHCASCAQGPALLTLYARGFTRPPFLMLKIPTTYLPLLDEHENQAGALVAALKLHVQRGDSDAPGHLPICWGVLAGMLGLTVSHGAYIHLFLHVRGVFSATIHMNTLGPYAAQQLLLHAALLNIKHMVDDALMSTAHVVSRALQDEIDPEHMEDRLPATTWPLGDLLAA
ncbi:hypothetical protein B0F90DRAFT_1800891 [Multifurca ochricompacta]|uniref:Uncharacterized protein n=1 Tax=Multifurca ochricompacta TaxID=376703 RepID=A0AAD4LT37_9AGAM|nr:hypothetical protein B0F90DRAFT_1800891 [Multifurca ochricompacta]